MPLCGAAGAFEIVRQLRLSPGFQTLTVRDVRLVVPQYGVDDEGQFTGDGSDSGIVVFTLGTFFLIESRKHRIMESRNICDQLDCPPQIG